jgi:hypothetical protein
MSQSGKIQNSTIDPSSLSDSEIDEQIATALSEVFKLLNLKEKRSKEDLSSSESSFTTAVEEEEVTKEVTFKPSPRKSRVENKKEAIRSKQATHRHPQEQRVEERVSAAQPYQQISNTQVTELEVGDRVLILNSHRNLQGATGQVIAIQKKQVSLRLDKEKWLIQRSKKNLRKISK